MKLLMFLLRPLVSILFTILIVSFILLAQCNVLLKWTAKLIIFDWTDNRTDDEKFEQTIDAIDELHSFLVHCVDKLYGRA